MASFTPNLNLRKIDLEDSPPDITVLNENFNILDEEVQNKTEYGHKHRLSDIEDLDALDVGGFKLMDESIPTQDRKLSVLYALKIRSFKLST